MAVELDVGVVGLKDALKKLNKMAPTLRRQITKDYKEIVGGVITDAQNRLPNIAPMTGMLRPWKTASGYEMVPDTGWDTAKSGKMIVAKISTRRPKMFGGTMENVGTFRLVWEGMANTMFDIAGRKSSGTVKQTSRMGSRGRVVGSVGGPQMIATLNARYGYGSRVLWPAYERGKNGIDDEMQKLVDRVMRMVNDDLAAAPDSMAAPISVVG